MVDDEQDVQHLESDRWHGEEVHARQAPTVIAMEGDSPLMGFGIDRTLRHVSRNGAF